MNSSQRFVSSPWEVSFGHFLPFDFTLSSRSRFNFSPFTKLVDPLYHKYSVIFSPGWPRRRLPMELSCPVSCKFPHGTLHYQSRKVFSSLVGGSTFFHPYLMYKCTRKSRVSFCTGCLVLPSFPFRNEGKIPFLLHPDPFSLLPQLNLVGFPQQALPISLATTLGLSVDFSSLVLRCFNSQPSSPFLWMLSHVWNPGLLSRNPSSSTWLIAV